MSVQLTTKLELLLIAQRAATEAQAALEATEAFKVSTDASARVSELEKELQGSFVKPTLPGALPTLMTLSDGRRFEVGYTSTTNNSLKPQTIVDKLGPARAFPLLKISVTKEPALKALKDMVAKGVIGEDILKAIIDDQEPGLRTSWVVKQLT